MVKRILVTMTDDKFEALTEKKGTRTWRQALFDAFNVEYDEQEFTPKKLKNTPEINVNKA